jgi:hypothetical protein
MADTDGSQVSRRGGVAALAAGCLLFACAGTAQAQYLNPPGIAAAPPAPGIFTRTSFHMFASKLAAGDDPKFDWSAHFGGDLDVIDYVKGRLVLIADYEAVIGSEFRGIDPNQGNYTLEPSLSWRVGESEVALTYHHVSRHLGDRAKTFAIDWNILGGRYLRRVAIGGATADVAVGAGTFVEHSHVDYRWTANGDLLIRRPINSRVGAFARATGETFGVDADVFHRDRQSGGRLEAGVRLAGTGGALELFGGFEQRVDADPLVNGSRRWPLFGFRFLSK